MSFPIKAVMAYYKLLRGLLMIFYKADNQDPRQFDLTDAIAVSGLYPSAMGGASDYPDDVCLYHGGTVLRVGNSGDVTISGGNVAVSNSNVIVSGGNVIADGILVRHIQEKGIN